MHVARRTFNNVQPAASVLPIHPIIVPCLGLWQLPCLILLLHLHSVSFKFIPSPTVTLRLKFCDQNVDTAPKLNIQKVVQCRVLVMFLAVPRQLYRWHCHSLSEWVSLLKNTTRESHPRNLWPLGYSFRVMTWPTEQTSLISPTSPTSPWTCQRWQRWQRW